MRGLRKTLAMSLALVFLWSGVLVIKPAEVSAEGGDYPQHYSEPVYHAAMGIQTATQIWIQRWGYYEGSQNEYYDTEDYNKLYDSQKKFYDGTFEDVEIRGNGTYTVSLMDADFAGETTISQLHIATDIPVEESEKLQFTDVMLEINGNEILKFDQAVMENEENYMQGGAVILLFNHWRGQLVEDLKGMGRGEDSSNGWELLEGSGSNNVSITFTVSGLPYDNEELVREDAIEETGQIITAAQELSGEDSIEDDTLSLKQIIGIVGLSLLMIIIVIRVIIIKRKDHM
ncbi:MAG: hypothetical protein K2J67_04145 [Lachnospiraceae bacterium]|nr:hypothetical protein [Lachnospiraceae bacterium]